MKSAHILKQMSELDRWTFAALKGALNGCGEHRADIDCAHYTVTRYMFSRPNHKTFARIRESLLRLKKAGLVVVNTVPNCDTLYVGVAGRKGR